MPTRTCECGKCKKCRSRAQTLLWRTENPERWKEIAAASYQRHRAKRIAERFRYRQENLEKSRATDREYNTTKRAERSRDPEKIKAQNLLNRAVARGDITPQPCEGCGVEAYPTHDGRRGVHAHHDDYSKPLDVRWLCYSCHGKEHRRYV